jgi:hypothetical protein
MNRVRALRTVLAVLVCGLAAAAAFAESGSAAATASVAATKQVAGTLETSVVVNRFTAVGTRVVGDATVTSVQRNAAGRTVAKTTKHTKLTIRQRALAGPGPCQVLLLELDELDLTLLGLHVTLHSATEGEPVRLTLTADSTHGVLGKLFCSLTNATITTPKTATTAASTLTRKLHSATVMRAGATLYSPQSQTSTSGSTSSSALQADGTDCSVLHLVLGPLHLDLLGLIVDLNKIVLDIDAIPGTTIGDLFCSLVGVGAPAPSPSGAAPGK